MRRRRAVAVAPDAHLGVGSRLSRHSESFELLVAHLGETGAQILLLSVLLCLGRISAVAVVAAAEVETASITLIERLPCALFLLVISLLESVEGLLDELVLLWRGAGHAGAARSLLLIACLREQRWDGHERAAQLRRPIHILCSEELSFALLLLSLVIARLCHTCILDGGLLLTRPARLLFLCTALLLATCRRVDPVHRLPQKTPLLLDGDECHATHHPCVASPRLGQPTTTAHAAPTTGGGRRSATPTTSAPAPGSTASVVGLCGITWSCIVHTCR
mmetsp:Transcript_37687/g.88152  ORF Transcript_37687/g.88152 Transcript_37687/m.88152 type:complete len:277 (-) Transcript_37687:81-911(-)